MIVNYERRKRGKVKVALLEPCTIFIAFDGRSKTIRTRRMLWSCFFIFATTHDEEVALHAFKALLLGQLHRPQNDVVTVFDPAPAIFPTKDSGGQKMHQTHGRLFPEHWRSPTMT